MEKFKKMKRRTTETHKADIDRLLSAVIAMVNNDRYNCNSAYDLYRYCQGWAVWANQDCDQPLIVGECPDDGDHWVSFDSYIEAEEDRSKRAEDRFLHYYHYTRLIAMEGLKDYGYDENISETENH